MNQVPFDIKAVDPLSESEWDREILNYSNYSFFHTSAWARVLVRTYGHRPSYYRLSKSGKTTALLPLMEVRSFVTGNRGVCLPFSDYCGPLISEDSDSTLITEKYLEIARAKNWKYIEIREGENVPAGTPISSKFFAHRLDLQEDLEVVFASFNGSIRRAIGKAERSGMNVEVLRTREAILSYYRLHMRTRRQFGIPPQSLAFFLNIYEEIIKPGLGIVVLAGMNSTHFAGGIFFQVGNRAVYKFGASDHRFQEFRGNNLVMWKAIVFLACSGAKTLHFGRTSPENEGLKRFKLGWNTTEETIKYHKFDILEGKWVGGMNRAATFHQAFFRRLPLMVNRLFGSLLYPHLD